MSDTTDASTDGNSTTAKARAVLLARTAELAAHANNAAAASAVKSLAEAYEALVRADATAAGTAMMERERERQ